MENQPQIPDGYICPITHEIMTDPVMAEDGHTYERLAIEQWLVNNQTSPNTNVALTHHNLIPNIALRKAIQEFTQGGALPGLAKQSLFAQNPSKIDINQNLNKQDKPEKPSCHIL